ncbi:MAG: hypothetical protein ACKPKO_25820, partial [Candidatus Fonsibacter sp.]
MLKRARGAVATFWGHKRLCRDLFGALYPQRDPLPSLVGMALERYAEEWWRAVDPAHKNGRVLKPGVLAAACWAAKAKLDKGERPRGPVGAMLS